MRKIGLLSDTHGYWDDKYLKYFADCDEIWHAGDIGSDEAEETLAEITREVNWQQQEYKRVFREVVAELERQHIHLYLDSRPEPFHEAFVQNFFNEEVFPFLAPVMIQKDDIRTFIRDRRLYLVIRMTKKRHDKESSNEAKQIPIQKTVETNIFHSVR